MVTGPRWSRWFGWLVVMALLVSPAVGTVWGPAAGKGKPNPYLVHDEPVLGPVSVPTMEQVFWVQVPVSPEVPVGIELPEGVALLDRTKPGGEGGRGDTRFYLRSSRGIAEDEGAVIRLVFPRQGNRTVEVPLWVRTYRQDIEHHIQNTSGVDPTARKQGRSYYTPERIALAKQNLEKHPALADQLRRKSFYEAMSDEELFASLPSWNVPREFYGNWPCPYCGEKIFRHSGFHPWKWDDRYPSKLQCPDCGKRFPSNDWEAGDFTSGEFPDDGWGWSPPGNDAENREGYYAWVAHFNHMRRYLRLGGHLTGLSRRYLLLGDEEAAHKVAILLARLAYIYPGMDMRWQQTDDQYLRPGRLLADGNHERNYTLVPAAFAYDAIYDAIDRDQKLLAFLQEKDPTIQTPDDIKALIETYFIQVLGWDYIDRNATGGNMGSRELNMIEFALAANMGEVSERWIQEVFTNAYNSGMNKGSLADQVFVNMRTREGPAWIAGLGYTPGYTRRAMQIAEALSHLDMPRWEAQANLYDRTQYPKVYSELETWMDFIVAGQFAPSWGDGAGPPGARFPESLLPQSNALHPWYEEAYRHWRTDRLARVLARLGPTRPSLFKQDIYEEIKAHAERVGPEPALRSRVMDGFGFVLLESRPEVEALNDRAGLALRYGYAQGHSHQDNLDVQLFAHGANLTPDLGYPTWAHPLGSTEHVAHHNTGFIDRSRQYTGNTAPGTLEQFAAPREGDPQGVSFADVSAKPNGFPNRVYRRAVALVDVAGETGDVYMFDVFRMAGGTVRTYGVHGPPYKALDSSAEFTPTGEEALDIGAMPRSAFRHNLLEPQIVETGDDVWMDWHYLDDPDQTWPGASAQGIPIEWPDVSSETHLRVHVLGEEGRRYFSAAYGKPDVPPTHFLFAEDEAEDGASEFVSIWEPYDGEPIIERIERLKVEGADRRAEYQPVAVRVHLTSGQVDTLVYTFDPRTALRIDGELMFQGSFGHWSERDGKLRSVSLVNGRHFHRRGEGVTQAPPPFEAKITAVDYLQRRATLSQPLPQDVDPQSLVGQMLFIDNGGRRMAYEIEAVLDDRQTVQFEHTALLFRSALTDSETGPQAVETELELSVEKAHGFPGGYYDGSVVLGEAATGSGPEDSAGYRIRSIEDRTLHLDRAVDPNDLADVDGDGRRMISIYEFGAGDSVILYRPVFKDFE